MCWPLFSIVLNPKFHLSFRLLARKKFGTLLIKRIWAARRPSTVEKYCYAVRRFFSYCSVNNIVINLPIDSLLAANYLIEISEKNGTKGAVSDALISLKWLHSFIPGLNSQNDPLQEEFLFRITQSINRTKAKMKE